MDTGKALELDLEITPRAGVSLPIVQCINPKYHLGLSCDMPFNVPKEQYECRFCINVVTLQVVRELIGND